MTPHFKLGSYAGRNLRRLCVSVLLLIFLVPVALVPQVQGYDIQNVKVPALYEPTTAATTDGRRATQLLPPMHTDFIMRGWMKWGTGLNRNYFQLKSSVSQLKNIMPGVIYQGGISAQFVDPHDTWASGLQISASDFDKMLARDSSGNRIPIAYGYMPDLASPVYRNYLIGWCKKQIDAGVDAIFFDGVYGYAGYKVSTMGRDPHVVNPQYAGYYKQVVDSLKSYAASKGRQFLAAKSGGVLAASVGIYQDYPVLLQSDDLIHGSFSTEVFSPPFVPVEDFAKMKANLIKVRGYEVPIIMYFDWAGTDPNTQMSKFVTLSTQDQITVLENIDAATKAAGILFAYPVYGGDTFAGKYDSVKYGTYNTIVVLATSTITITVHHIKAVITNNGYTNSFMLKVFTTSNVLVCKQSASINRGSTVTLDCQVNPGTYVVRVFYGAFTRIYGPVTVTVPPDAVIPITYP